MREVGGCGWGALREAPVVLDAGGEVAGREGGVDVCGFFAVDRDGVLVGVGWAGGYGEDVFVRHGGGGVGECP